MKVSLIFTFETCLRNENKNCVPLRTVIILMTKKNKVGHTPASIIKTCFEPMLIREMQIKRYRSVITSAKQFENHLCYLPPRQYKVYRLFPYPYNPAFIAMLQMIEDPSLITSRDDFF